MPSIIATPQAKKVVICGQGIRVDTRYELGPDAFIVPPSISVRAEDLEVRTSSALEYAARAYAGILLDKIAHEKMDFGGVTRVRARADGSVRCHLHWCGN